MRSTSLSTNAEAVARLEPVQDLGPKSVHGLGASIPGPTAASVPAPAPDAPHTVDRSQALSAARLSSVEPNPRDADSQPGDPRVERLFEMTSDLLATISLDGRFTLLNPAWEAVLGWTRAELEANPIDELIHPDDVEQ